MVPAAFVDSTLAELTPLLAKDDIVIDGGNSYYIDDIRRAKELAKKGIHYVDVGTSGGVWGLERGYCLMIGGSKPQWIASIRYSARSRREKATPSRRRAANRARARQKMDICIAVKPAADTS